MPSHINILNLPLSDNHRLQIGIKPADLALYAGLRVGPKDRDADAFIGVRAALYQNCNPQTDFAGLEFGLFGNESRNVNGLQLSVGKNKAQGVVAGLQIAGGYNEIRHDLILGAQVALGVNIVRHGEIRLGAMIAGLGNGAKEVFLGLLTAGFVNSVSNRVFGLEIAGMANFNYSWDDKDTEVSGLQVAGVLNRAGNVNGVQIAGLGNRALEVKGAQIGGGGNVSTKSLFGVQLAGVLNSVKKSLAGLQLGLVNNIENLWGLLGGIKIKDFFLGLYHGPKGPLPL